MFVCLLAFDYARRSASRQGHGLRFAPGTRLAQFPDTLASLAAANCAPEPCTRRPYAGPKSQLPEGKQNRRPAWTPDSHRKVQP